MKNVKESLTANQENLSTIIYKTFNSFHNPNSQVIDPIKWEQSEYHPTPTIIQAAKALFAGQKVEAITKTEAESKNIFKVTNYIIDLIKDAEQNKRKVVCFVTGVPGAVGNNANKNKIWSLAEMDADHVSAWSKGGATDIKNCQMLCKTHNRAKGNK